MRKYRAFISYSHADEAWGRRLHRRLERYFTPRALRGTEGRDGPVPKRIFPIFRDREELPTSSDLGGVINGALEESDYLIVICSPRSAQSKWVNQEILNYKRLGRSNRILCLIVDGEPGASAIQGKEQLECFPPAIRLEIGEDGELSDRPAEPIAADARDGKDGWSNAFLKLAAGLLGVDYDALKRRDVARRRRVAAGWTAAAAAVAGVAVFGVLSEREARRAEAREASRAQALTAQEALNRGETRAALAALAGDGGAFAAYPDPASPDEPPPRAALTALARAAFETRLLADYPAPTGPDVTELHLLPEGAVALVEQGGRTHLLDPGTGETVTIYDPDRWTHTRVSADAKTLWTAHFEAETQDETGAWYAPLLFEEIDLATGEERLATAVRSVAAYSGAAEISPDGAFFAVDLGPGEGEQTVIGVFRREAQELAGVLTLPSDRADLWFVGPDRILARVQPPTPGPGAPGFYLWTVGDEAPTVLRPPGETPVCDPGDDPAETRSVGFALTPTRDEAVLYISGADAACLVRWSMPEGAAQEPVRIGEEGDWAAALAAGGPYVFGSDYWGAERIASPGSPARRLRDCGAGLFGLLDRNGGRESLLCADRDGAAIHFGPSGEMRWSRRLHDGGLKAYAYDSEGRRLFTIGADARLRIWDAGPRSRGLIRVDGALQLSAGPDGRLAALSEDRRIRMLAADGSPVGPPVAQPHPGAVRISALGGVLLGVFTYRPVGFTETDGDGAENRFTVIDAATSVAVAGYEGLASRGGDQPRLSADGGRFLLITAASGAIWGDGATGRALTAIDLGPDRPIRAGDAAGRRFALLASNGERDDPARRVMTLLTGGDGGDAAAPAEVASWPAQGGEIRLSPDGTRALVELHRAPPDDNLILLVDIATGAETPLARSPYLADRIGFSPDGARVDIQMTSGGETAAGAALNGPAVFDAATGALILQLPPTGILADPPVWSPRGRRIAHPAGPLRVFELGAGKGGSAEICPGIASEAVKHVAFGPAGRLLAFERQWEDGGEGVEVYDLETCSPLRRIGARLAGAAPVFPAADRIWLPLDGEIVEAPLAIDPAMALAALRARAARLGAAE